MFSLPHSYVYATGPKLMHDTPAEERRSLFGFTLIELLTVMAIIGIIAAVALPAASTILTGSQLTQGTQMVTDQLGLARQKALTKNHSVEVRFYQFADANVAGEQSGPPDSGQYRALQVFEVMETGAAVPVGKVQRLPSSIIIDKGNGGSGTLSSLVDRAAHPEMAKTKDSWTPLDPQTRVSGAGTNEITYNCSYFRFLPNGSTDLNAPSAQWFLTLRNLNSSALPPANFTTIQVDAYNGHLRTFRP